MSKANTQYKIDFSKGIVTITKKFHKESQEYNSTAFNMMKELRSMGMQIVIREEKERKACPTRLTYAQKRTNSVRKSFKHQLKAAKAAEQEALALQKKAHDLGAELVLVTNGSKGQKLWDGSSAYEGEVKMVEAVDTMGAGDSFFTAFVVQLMREGYRRGNIPPEECIRKAFSFAADFSAQTCLKDGAFGFGTRY